MSFECQNCIGMIEYGCYCDAMRSAMEDAKYGPCPCCDGAGEWDEGPLPASSGATEPEYRQVICPECNGTGLAPIATDRTLDDMDAEDLP